MSTPIEIRSRTLYLGDEELFVRVTEVDFDPDHEVATYTISTIWADGHGAWHECRTVTVSLEYQPEEAACLAGFTAELQPAQLVYTTNPDLQKAQSIAILIGGDETCYFLSAPTFARYTYLR